MVLLIEKLLAHTYFNYRFQISSLCDKIPSKVIRVFDETSNASLE